MVISSDTAVMAEIDVVAASAVVSSIGSVVFLILWSCIRSFRGWEICFCSRGRSEWGGIHGP